MNNLKQKLNLTKKLKATSYKLSNKLKSYNLQAKTGFTLLEVILVVAVVSILAGIGVPIYSNLQVKNDLDVATNTTLQTLRRAQVLSQAVDGDTTWGVKISTDKITLFKGSSFALRDTTYDEDYPLSSNVTISGISEVVFSKMLGVPNTTGVITLTSLKSDVQNITLNSKGFLDY